MEYHAAFKRKSLTDHNTDEPQGHYAERNKPVTKVKIT